MNTIAQGNIGGMVITNSNLGGLGGGAGMVNTLKQQIGAGAGGIMNAGPGGVGPVGNMGPVGGANQGMHLGGGPGHPQSLQNGPMMGRMVGQHLLRGPNPHLMSGNGPGVGPGGGPRMQNPNMQMGMYFIDFLTFHNVKNIQRTVIRPALIKAANIGLFFY